MPKVEIWPINLQITLTKLDMFAYQLPGTVKARIEAMAKLILEDSRTVEPMVPVKTGALQATGRVQKAPGGFAVVYGGSGVTYANQVHDDLRPRRYTKPGSGPKFVETHYLRRTEGGDDDIAQTLAALSLSILGK